MKISLDELIKSGAHFGHQSKRWNPKMEPYLFGEKDGVHVFDLEKTGKALEEVLNFLRVSAKEGKSIFFLGTKKQAKTSIEKFAKEAGCNYINERWLGGIITNFAQIKKSVDKMEEMKKNMASGGYSEYTKKERLLLEREIQRLERFFGGLKDIKNPPEILVIVDIKRESGALREALSKGLTTIALVDSNCDPNLVDYPIPMNDDATKAIEYVLSLMAEAVKEGKQKAEGKRQKEESVIREKI